jgi:hypothetical protein
VLYNLVSKRQIMMKMNGVWKKKEEEETKAQVEIIS